MSAHSATRDGRPAPAAGTREAILAAAEAVIRERGVLATTTRRIAERAGCSEGSLYTHFAGKDELVARVVCERFASFPERARVLPELAGSGEVEAHLAELAALAIDFFADAAPMIGAMMADPASTRGRAAELDAAGKGPRRTIEAVIEYLRREQALGRVAADASLEGAAAALVGGAWHHAHLTAAWDLDLFGSGRDPAAELARAVAAGLGSADPAGRVAEAPR